MQRGDPTGLSEDAAGPGAAGSQAPRRDHAMPSLRVPLPPGCLDLVFAHERRRVLRYEAGLYLDPMLRRLSRVSGAVDRALARGLLSLRSTRGYLRLGYARFADYARERVDMSVRTAQEMVRLGAGLERLPVLDEALGEGRVTWTAALQVARVARREDEACWVELAERVPLRELRRAVDEAVVAVRGAAEASSDGRADVEVESKGSSAGSEEDEDPVVRLSVPCPWVVWRLWQAALELCGLMVGGSMAAGEGPEYLLADLLSGLPAAAEDGRGAEYPCSAPIVPGHRLSGRGRLPVAALAAELGDRALSAAEHGRIERLLERVEGGEEGTGGDPFAIDRRLRELVAARAELESDLARLLRLFRSFELARQVGYESFRDYVAERLGISASRAEFLVRLDYRMTEFREVARAVRRGEIGTVAALLVCRVARRETERAWIERARRRTVVRLRREVEWAERERGRTWHGEVWPPATAGKLPSELDSVTEEILAGMRSEESGGGAASSETFARGAGSTVGPETFAQGAGSETLAHDPGWGRPWRVDFRMRASALGLWREAQRRLAALAGRSWVSDQQVVYETALAFLKTHLPSWIDEVRHGDPIAVREHFRCIVPGCTSRCGSVHHIVYRSRGGTEDEWNRGFMCHAHHLVTLHTLGALRVTGRAPDGLVFELGVRPDGTALEVFFNEERIVAHETRREVTKETGGRESVA